MFKWERDYGPLWEPGSTAFWLEPETHQQLANWYAEHRPNVTGFVEAAGLRIEIVPAVSQFDQQMADIRQQQQLFNRGLALANLQNQAIGGLYSSSAQQYNLANRLGGSAGLADYLRNTGGRK